MRYQHFGISASIIAAALVAAPIAHAQSTTDKVQQKLEDTGSEIKGAARDAKVGLGDSWITAKTKIALLADERVKGRQVSVETANAVVALRGKVDSVEAKSAAESIAKGIDGVRRVRNDLQVVAPTERPLVDANDADLQQAVEDRFAKDARLSRVEVRADRGIVTLTGDVDGMGTSVRASEVARAIPGVRAVRNELDVAAAPADARRIGASMERGPQQHVRLVQEALKREGHDPGAIDGVIGPRTAAALESYQRAENLSVTGRADAQTLGKLGVGIGGGSGAPKRQSP